MSNDFNDFIGELNLTNKFEFNIALELFEQLNEINKTLDKPFFKSLLNKVENICLKYEGVEFTNLVYFIRTLYEDGKTSNTILKIPNSELAGAVSFL